MVYFRHQGRCDGYARMKHMKYRTETVQAIQQCTVELDNNAAAGGRSVYPVHFTGWDYDDIIYIQIVCFFIDDDLVGILYGHDDFGVGMPVQGIVFIYPVQMDQGFKITVIIHGFMNSIQSFNQKTSLTFFLLCCCSFVIGGFRSSR